MHNLPLSGHMAQYPIIIPSPISCFPIHRPSQLPQSVAMDALYALEREEAIWHTEYEAQNSDVTCIHGRLSKSATTSPVRIPSHTTASPQTCQQWQDDDGASRMMDKAVRNQPSVTTSLSSTTPDQFWNSTVISQHLSTCEDSPPLSSASASIPPSHRHSTHLAYLTSYPRTCPIVNLNSSAGPTGMGNELSPPSWSASKPEFTFTPFNQPVLWSIPDALSTFSSSVAGAVTYPPSPCVFHELVART
ncbi:hypothetical protein M404DRAFT_25551 [Pisolithus tinctorius Marx 270]|uniref:Uncharacterized protein n=1 Tax=Pisolithus tinctorius Marx 270 TaxID=870435 RepID=A0A0C3PCI0_PISTI|nr:hypothetical protein M404DRAFT_25551 [Pisolithus tinctorius Marx 270]